MQINEHHTHTAVSSLENILKLLGLAATVTGTADESAIKLTVASDEAGRIIGRKGRTLSAIQLLLNGILRKDNDFDARVDISIDGYEKSEELHNRADGRKRSRPRTDRKDRGRNKNAAPGRDQQEEPKKSRTNHPSEAPPEVPEESQDEFMDIDFLDDLEESSPVEEKAEAIAPAPESVPEPEPEQTPEAPIPTAAPTEAPIPAAAPTEAPREEPRNSRPRDTRDRDHDRDRGRDQRSRHRDSPSGRATDNASTGLADPQRAHKQAIDAAKEVKRWGENVTLPPMSEDECQAAIAALKGDDSVIIVDDGQSSGERKRLTVALSGRG